MDLTTHLQALFSQQSPAERTAATAKLLDSIQTESPENRWRSRAPALAAELLAAFPNEGFETSLADIILQTVESAPDDPTAIFEISQWTKSNAAVTNAVLRRATQQSTPISDNQLQYLVALFKAVRPESVREEVLQQLFRLLLNGLTESRPSQAALEIVLTLVPLVTPSQNALIWKSIRDQGICATASRLWFKWVSQFTSDEDVYEILQDNQYWETLLKGLLVGTMEVHKYNLAVLKLSIGILDHDVNTESLQFIASQDKKKLRDQIWKFCTLFQAIILDRYLNQVQQCLGDVERLIYSDLKPVWIDTLLKVALRQTQQEGIRRVIGYWYMNTTAENPSLLRKDVLNVFYFWAAQHSFFLSTSRKRRRWCFSRHGQKLSKFFERLLSKPESAEEKNALIEVALTPLLERATGLIKQDEGKVSPYACIYILDGIYKGLEGAKVSPAIMLQLCTMFGIVRSMAEVIRDAVSVYCMNMPHETDEGLENSPAFKEVKAYWEKLNSTPMPKQVYKYERLREPSLNAFIRYSKIIPGTKTDTIMASATASLIQSVQPSLNYSVGKNEGYEYACVMDLLNRLPAPSPSSRKELLNALLEPWSNQKPKGPIVVRWKTTMQLQMLLILSESCVPEMDQEECISYLFTLIRILGLEAFPRYRYLLEWTIIRVYALRPEVQPYALSTLAEYDNPNKEPNPKLLASLMRIATKIACLPTSTSPMCLQLLTLLIPHIASAKVAVRYEAQWCVPLLWDRAVEGSWTDVTSNPAFEHLDKYIRAQEKYKTPPEEKKLEKFDPVEDHTLANLFMGRYLQIYPQEAEMLSVADFEEVWKDDERAGIQLPPPKIPLGVAPPEKELEEDDVVVESLPAPVEPASDPIPLQTKGLQELRLTANTTLPPRAPLITIGSLLDKPHNLGGLSRCSEIFGASLLTLPNNSLLSNRDFLSVAVTSHNHLPMEPVPPAELPAWLREKKREGYTVVGVEQTDKSLVLGTEGAKLPYRMCMVLGAERTGIPADVLGECEVCVEVRQVGVTRSLNVQTAASVVLYEWQRQYGGK